MRKTVLRYKTVAEFGTYAVIEPTEPVEKIEIINIHRKPEVVKSARTQADYL